MTPEPSVDAVPMGLRKPTSDALRRRSCDSQVVRHAADRNAHDLVVRAELKGTDVDGKEVAIRRACWTTRLDPAPRPETLKPDALRRRTRLCAQRRCPRAIDHSVVSDR